VGVGYRARLRLTSVGLLLRRPQLRGAFVPGDITSGYYNDMRDIAGDHGSPSGALMALQMKTADRRVVHPISIAQLGLGAWQLAAAGDPRWLEVVSAVSDWIAAELDSEGLIAFEFAYPHTYRLEPPWYSAMAQGESASLLLRAGLALGRPELTQAAVRTVSTFLRSDSPVVAATDEGPVLEEYPTNPPAHVLNGWIYALWGLYDVAAAGGDLSEDAHSAFSRGVDALEARLPLYSTGWNWSRYDLFPHPIIHVTSPFYHRLHVEQLRAMHDLDPRPVFAATASRWELGVQNPFARTHAVARKVAFRVLRPRKKVS
jgi:heparosan-N-sulfate-glucuronate 5-epimerase